MIGLLERIYIYNRGVGVVILEEGTAVSVRCA